MDNCLQRITVQRRQIAPLGNVDSRQQPVDRLLWSGYRKIAAKQHLVEHAPLGGQAEGVILRPRSIELSRNVRIDVRVFWRNWQRECDVWPCVLERSRLLMGERRRRALTPYLFA